MGAVSEMNVKQHITNIEYKQWGKATVVGLATLTNGIEIVESVSFRRPEKFNQAIGEAIIKERVHHRVFELVGGVVEAAKEEAPARRPGRPKKEVVQDDNEVFNG